MSESTEREFHMRAYLLLLTCCLAGCSSASGPGDPQGRYDLAKVNGQTLPYDEGPEPPRPGGATDCNALIRRGALELSANDQTFSFWYEHGHTCSERVLGRSEVVGSYRRTTEGLALIAPTGPRQSETYSARVTGNVVQFQSRFYSFVFAR